ncbi:hypothetical protein [Xenorhabdus bovienii]|uniref:hypothetical protein n=1 Tax=Xenorhabdus bovienii TaxID=40576 RepID=UPI00237CD032|nr:hypothetical protein [Xenorhabdus bovienii]MDE1494503.1 hypothetical protein [Xenorhabdus bovienii]MDE9429064.1 hypothetical protein [Xenorhabdus bovienii]MDE9437411.1 hypothetical protein [Xenorhabdus bovienii]MDE9462592.1 hypothetical protein [Xenorhabdus bovienii]MDE9464635.1 hypothetical protein [Xenorhabdus bovienii]
MQNIDDVIEIILNAALTAVEHENNSDCVDGVTHISILGGKRRVEYYPTTGMVYSNPVKDIYSRVRLPKAGIRRAIKLAKTGN